MLCIAPHVRNDIYNVNLIISWYSVECEESVQGSEGCPRLGDLGNQAGGEHGQDKGDIIEPQQRTSPLQDGPS